jgi:rubrerythrin
MGKIFIFTVFIAGIFWMQATFAWSDTAAGNNTSVVASPGTALTTPTVKAQKRKKIKKAAKSQSEKTVWVCPMGDFTGDKPGKCPNCGMDLVEKK